MAYITKVEQTDLEKKYLNNATFCESMLTALDEFFQYFKTVWVTSKEHFWFESANPFRSSNNQGVEGGLPIGSFIDVQADLMCFSVSVSKMNP